MFSSESFSSESFSADSFDLGVIAQSLGGVRKRKTKRVGREFFPWSQPENDFIDEEVLESLKPKRPKLRIVRKAEPDFDTSVLEPERIDRELVLELKRIETERKKRARRHKAAIMLLLS